MIDVTRCMMVNATCKVTHYRDYWVWFMGANFYTVWFLEQRPGGG